MNASFKNNGSADGASLESFREIHQLTIDFPTE
jgi:hypothetical protein